MSALSPGPRAIACIEVGWNCGFVARGRGSRETEGRFWLHARRHHRLELSMMTVAAKARLQDLVEALTTSSRRPYTSDVPTSPMLRELEATGVVRRWWA